MSKRKIADLDFDQIRELCSRCINKNSPKALRECSRQLWSNDNVMRLADYFAVIDEIAEKITEDNDKWWAFVKIFTGALQAPFANVIQRWLPCYTWR